jgi:nucleotide-binding universal stress UspA family protein
MIDVRRILCPVDFSPHSLSALQHGVSLARWYEAELTILHVVPLLPAVFTLPAGGLSTAPLPRFDSAAVCREVRDFAQPAIVGVGAEIEIREGSAAAEILDYVSEADVDLVVLGTHGRTGFERFMLGSVTERVLRRAPCPVLTVPRAEEEHGEPLFKNVLCGVDFSEASSRAARYALSLAQEGRSRLTLLHVVDWMSEEELARYPHLDPAGYQKLWMSEAGERLETLVPEDARTWCEVSTQVACGKAHREVLRIAADEHVDLIVMGVHGRDAIDLLLFGSTIQHVVRHATCPVLTVPSSGRGLSPVGDDAVLAHTWR